MAVARVVSVAMLAGSLMAVASAAQANATQPSIMRPEITQVHAATEASGDCQPISTQSVSDESLFGTDGADGVR